jgi:hypothetical protein
MTAQVVVIAGGGPTELMLTGALAVAEGDVRTRSRPPSTPAGAAR